MTNRMIRGLLPLVAITLGTWVAVPRLPAQESEAKPAAEEGNNVPPPGLPAPEGGPNGQ